MQDNFDVDIAMQEGLQVQVHADGHNLDIDIDNLFLYKYQNPAGERSSSSHSVSILNAVRGMGS